MRIRICELQPGIFCLAVLLAASLVVAGHEVPNVAVAWNIKASGDAGSADQTILPEQDGRVTGTFKWPRHPGKLEGNTTPFHVKTGSSTGLHGNG